MEINQTKIDALTQAVQSKESDNTKKMNQINQKIDELIGPAYTYDVVNSDGKTEKKPFDGKSTDDEITSIAIGLIPDTNAIDKTTGEDPAKPLRDNLIAAFKITRDTLSTLAPKQETETNESSENTNNETNNLATDILKPGQYTIEELQTLKNKTWKDLWTDPKYIITIQHIIVDTGAKHSSISNKLLTNGIYGRGTKAGIKTLQTYLNTKYNANLGTPDGLIGPATLKALLEMDGDKTRLEKIIADHTGITPETPAPISQNTNKKGPGTGNTGGGGNTQRGNTNSGSTTLDQQDEKELQSGDIIQIIQDSFGNYYNSQSIILDKVEYITAQEIFTIKIKQNNNRIATWKLKKSDIVYDAKDKNKIDRKQTDKKITKTSQDTIPKPQKTDKEIIKQIEDNENREINIDTVLKNTQHSPTAYAKIIEKAITGLGTEDEELQKILNNIITQKNFLKVNEAYKKNDFELAGDTDLLSLLLDENYSSRGEKGYDAYFIRFIEGLIKQYPKEMTTLLKGKTISYEFGGLRLRDSTIFTDWCKANNFKISNDNFVLSETTKKDLKTTEKKKEEKKGESKPNNPNVNGS